MPKYMVQASYTREGIQGVVKEGGTSRKDAIGKMIADMGGSLETIYFTFGDDDILVIADLPDNAAAAAIGIAVGASGAATTKTVVLLTPEEIDSASSRTVGYRAPGA